MFVLDSSTVIDYFKSRGRVAEHLLATPPSEIGLSSIVLYELEVGAERSRRPDVNRRHIEELRRLATFLPFGADEARAAARIRAALEDRGQKIGPYDTLIAATALANGATLVTHNVEEFGRIEGLAIDDWF